MQKSMSALQQHRKNEKQEAFFRLILDVAPGLERYVNNRLRTAERKGLIPVDLYTPQDILDEVLLEVYEHFDDMPQEESSMRVKLFQLANERLDEIIRQEAWRLQSLRLEAILADEMRMLNEIPQITVDADGDIVMVEDLDDAELEPPEPRALLLEDSFEDEIIKQTGLEGVVIKGDRALQQLLARVYADLPAQSRIIFDLWTRGKLTMEEIASVRGISIEQVRDTLQRIQARFASLLR